MNSAKVVTVQRSRTCPLSSTLRVHAGQQRTTAARCQYPLGICTVREWLKHQLCREWHCHQ